MEFFEFMSQTKKLVAESLKLFPIMDIVFTFFFRAMLIYGHQTDHFDNYLEKQETFEFLTSYFGIDACAYEQCIRFEDTDVFTYEEN